VVTVHLEEEGESSNGTPDPAKNHHRALRTNRILEFTILKTTSIKDIKLFIMNKKTISPISQQIRYKNRILEADETMESIGLLVKDELRCILLEEKDSNGNHGTEGFGGTALVGAVPCPQCTLLNPPGSLMCTACELHFGFE